MNRGFLLRGRDVTTLVCALWGLVFAGIGLATMAQSGPFSPIRWYGETMSDAVGRSCGGKILPISAFQAAAIPWACSN